MGTAQYRLLKGDAGGLIKDVPDASVDLILTDPPYNLGKYSTGNIKLSWRRDINNGLAEWDRIEFNPHDWVREFKRVLKPKGNLFAFTSYNMLGRWHEAFDPEFDTFQFMVWHKTNPAPKIYKAGFLNSCELIICAWDKGHVWNFLKQNEMHNFFESPVCMGRERLSDPKHPTQKPVKVLKHIIGIASDPGAVVFDPFMGVGSTGAAALATGRTFLGFEVDTAYFSAAEKRLQEATRDLSREGGGAGAGTAEAGIEAGTVESGTNEGPSPPLVTGT
jgi:site-specific DNA-methyltransferase (adenine-specific)/modification methylase